MSNIDEKKIKIGDCFASSLDLRGKTVLFKVVDEIDYYTEKEYTTIRLEKTEFGDIDLSTKYYIEEEKLLELEKITQEKFNNIFDYIVARVKI